MKELTCIVCPHGCSLRIEELPDGRLDIKGNRCSRGIQYAREEITAPKRTVTATCPLASAGPGALVRRVPVRTSAPCPREKIGELLADMYGTAVSLPVAQGDVIIADWKGSGIDVIATRSLQ